MNYNERPCQNIKTLKINLSKGFCEMTLSGYGQYWAVIKQK